MNNFLHFRLKVFHNSKVEKSQLCEKSWDENSFSNFYPFLIFLTWNLIRHLRYLNKNILASKRQKISHKKKLRFKRSKNSVHEFSSIFFAIFFFSDYFWHIFTILWELKRIYMNKLLSYEKKRKFVFINFLGWNYKKLFKSFEQFQTHTYIRLSFWNFSERATAN